MPSGHYEKIWIIPFINIIDLNYNVYTNATTMFVGP